jgi:hypothetical protein
VPRTQVWPQRIRLRWWCWLPQHGPGRTSHQGRIVSRIFKYHIMTLNNMYYISEKVGQILFMTEDMLFTLHQGTAAD